ncbi:MAG: endonuclease domain-containing protein, partial [Caulobacteraceae bacterium]
MACSGRGDLPPSPNGEGQTAKPSGWGGVGKPAGVHESARLPHPSCRVAPSHPPHKGREDAREIVHRARELRKALTPQEARLWPRLRALRVNGFHFRRQAPFLDFVCFKRKLVVEIDGGQH